MPRDTGLPPGTLMMLARVSSDDEPVAFGGTYRVVTLMNPDRGSQPHAVRNEQDTVRRAPHVLGMIVFTLPAAKAL